MDDTGRLGGGHAGLDRPGTGLLLTGGEVGAQPQQRVGGADQALQTALLHPQAGEKLGTILLRQLDQLRLHLRRDAHGAGTLRLRQNRHLLAVGIA